MLNQDTKSNWRAFAGICLASFLGCIDFTIVNTALPAIQTNLHASVTQLQWIINIFMLALAAFMVVMGRLADIYGRRLLLYIGMILFALSSLGAGLSPTIHWLIVFRLLQGVAVAILYTVPIAIVPSLFPESKRGKVSGILFGVNGFGLAIGPVIGGFILSVLSWRWIFLVNLPIIAVSFLLCIPTLIESRSSEHNATIDWWGLILLIIALPCLIFATVQGSSWGWGSPIILGLYILAALALIAFYMVESKTKSPIIQFHLFANHMFIMGIIANIALAFFYTVAFFLMPLYLHNIFGQSSYQIGLTLLSATVMVAILSPVVGHVVDKIGAKKMLLFGFACFALTALILTQVNAQSHLIMVIVALVLMGIGWASILSPSFVAALSSIPTNMAGVGMGAIGTLHNFGGAIGLALGTVVYQYQAKHILNNDLLKNKIATNAWVNQVISNPDNAVTTLMQQTNIGLIQATNLFKHFFIKAFTTTMWLLIIVSLLALITILLGLKNRKLN